MITNENRSICSACKGGCCKAFPGIYSPFDIKGDMLTWFKANVTNITFDDWSGTFEHNGISAEDPLFLRPKAKNEHSLQIKHGLWYGECKLLTDEGCSLSFTDRPTQCRELKPDADRKCVIEGKSKKDLIFEWLPYQELIWEFINSIDKD